MKKGLLFSVALVAVLSLTGCTGADSDTSAKTEATASDEACPKGFVQVESNHTNNRVVGNFDERYATATAEAKNLSEAQRQLLFEEAGKDATVLARWSYAFGLVTEAEANATDALVEDKCLSRKGEQLYRQLEGALNAKGTTIAEGEAPANWINSGVFEGIFGVDAIAGINGDRRAIVVTLQDGTKVYILVRCGNPVFPNRPSGLPEVPTDNPPPPTVTPPDDAKSSNLAEWRGAGDDSTRDSGTGPHPGAVNDGYRPEQPVDTGGDAVNEHRPGGAISTPTDPPGAPGGGTAPGGNSGTSGDSGDPGVIQGGANGDDGDANDGVVDPSTVD